MDYQYRIFEPKNRQIKTTVRNVLLYSLFHNEAFWFLLRNIIKHLNHCQLKGTGLPQVFNPLHGVWISDETLLLVFDNHSSV